MLTKFKRSLFPVCVRLAGLPPSFQEWLETPVVAWPAANCVRGILRHFDVDDLLSALGDRLEAVDYWGPGMAPG